MLQVKHLAPCICAAAALLPAAAARASTVEQGIEALAGHWEGEAQDGAKVTFTLDAGQGDLVATGSWNVDGGALAGENDFSILHTANQFYLVPDKSPFTAGKEAYTLAHLPSGLKFVRLAHPAQGEAGVQSEELEIGKLRANGTRTMKIGHGERMCADPASPAGKPCGQAVTETIIVHKVAG